MAFSSRLGGQAVQALSGISMEIHRGEFVAVTGPNRAMAKPLGWYFAAPHGAMMLSGCFGLVRGVRDITARFAQPSGK